jgi:chromosome partitioning protein
MDVRFMHYEATSIIALEQTLLSADESGRYDYCLLNLAGVDHPFNRKVLRYAEMTLLPFAPAALDLMELPEALTVIKKLGEDGEIGDARVVFSRMKSRMTVAQQDYVQDVIEHFPRLVTEIKDTAILADLVMRGLLGKSIAHFEPIAKSLQVSEVNNLKNALASCNVLLDEIDTLIDAQE